MSATLNGTTELRDMTQYHADTIKLFDSLKAATVGDVFTYNQLTKLLGTDITKRRNCLTTAVKLLRRLKSIVFGTVRGIGIKCLKADEIVAGEETTLRAIRRKARAGVERISTVDIGKLPTETRAKALAYQAGLSASLHVSGRQAHGRLLEKISNNENINGNINLLLDSMKGT